MDNRDRQTLYAALLGFSLIVGAMVIGGASHFLNISGILIVGGGTLGATLLTYSLSEIRQAVSLFRQSIFNHSDKRTTRIKSILQLAYIAREHGILALESMANRERDPFYQRAINLIVDGTKGEEARRVLSLEAQLHDSAESRAAELFRTMGTIAPAMGLVGTLIGLIQMLNQLDNPSSLGPAMAVALLTTFYGAVFAHMFCLPAAAKLQRIYEQEALLKELTIEGMLAISLGTNPRMVEQQILSLAANHTSAYGT